MVGTSLDSNNDLALKTNSVKFLCSYGGKILPRYPDGKLRYVGGETRVLAVDRSVPFSELLVKLCELCGSSVSMRCQLPKEDLDALVSIKSDEDLENLIEEYDRANHGATPPLKIRAFLSPLKSVKSISPPPLAASPIGGDSSSAVGSRTSRPSHPATNQCVHQISTLRGYPVRFERPAAGTKLHSYVYLPHGNSKHIRLVRVENHWQ